jgi:hypothetical protein
MKIQKEYVMIILTCEKYKYKAEYQKKTWLSNFPIFYLHIIGKEDLTSEYKLDLLENILYVKCIDDYNHLSHKTFLALKSVNTLFEYKYIYKTDDDQELLKPGLFSILHNLFQTKEIHYGGKVNDIKQPYYSQYYKIHPTLPQNIIIYPTKYCSGRFYFLSKEAIQYLLKQQYYICREYFEDYAIGYCLHSEYKKNIFHLNTDTFFKDIPEENYNKS